MILATEQARMTSPLGTIEVSGNARGILSVRFVDDRAETRDPSIAHLRDCLVQLREYFQGQRRDFHSLPLSVVGTAFKADVWSQLLRVQYGETVTYGEVARRLGRASASRAVGGAVGANPFTIIIPCHRVIPAGGSTGNYAWGPERKEWLITHERRLSP